MSSPTAPPVSFRAGTTVAYTRSFGAYRANDGWALQFLLRGPSVLDKAGAANGSSFDVTLTAAETSLLQPGTYHWVERLSKGDEVRDGASGRITVLVNLATAGEGDLQSWEEKAIEALKASILGTATNDQQQLQIQSTMIVRYSLEEKKTLLSELETRLAAQRSGTIGRTHLARFRNPA